MRIFCGIFCIPVYGTSTRRYERKEVNEQKNKQDKTQRQIADSNADIEAREMLLKEDRADFESRVESEVEKKIQSTKFELEQANEDIVRLKARLTSAQDKIKEYSLEENVIITGPLYKEEKQEALVDCDLFVIPSKYESFTTSGLEAMACSKPLVLTKNNHIHDWVDGIVGIACEDNKDSLREAIEKVLFDEELSQIFAENGNKLIKEKYNWDIINNQILEIYNRYL